MKTNLFVQKPAHLVVTLKPKTWVEPEKMMQTIRDAGYEPRKEDLRLVLVGNLKQEGDRFLLTLDDLQPKPVSLLLQPYSGEDEKLRKASEEAMAQLKDWVGKSIEVEGNWEPPANKKEKAAPALLFIRRVGKPAPPPSTTS